MHDTLWKYKKDNDGSVASYWLPVTWKVKGNRFIISLMTGESKIADSVTLFIQPSQPTRMHWLGTEVTVNEHWRESSANSDAVFMSYQISCKYKLSSGRNCSRHSARGNYQQDMGFFIGYNVLNLKLWMKRDTHKANMVNADSRGKLKWKSSVITWIAWNST